MPGSYLDGVLLDFTVVDGARFLLRMEKESFLPSQSPLPGVMDVSIAVSPDAAGELDAFLQRVRSAPELLLYRWLELQWDDGGALLTVFVDEDFEKAEFPIQDAACHERGYTREELEQRCLLLASAWNRSETEAHQARTRLSRYIDSLTKEVTRELDRCQRKRSFFADTDPARAAAMQERIVAYQRVLDLIAYPL